MTLSLAQRRRAAGMGSFGFGPDEVWSDIPDTMLGGAGAGVYNPTSSDGGSSDIPWYVSGAPTIGVIGKTLSNIFGNQYQQPTYAQSQYRAPQTNYAVAPSGWRYDSSGNLVKAAANNITDFITTNPLLVGGAILGVILLFRQPPGRR